MFAFYRSDLAIFQSHSETTLRYLCGTRRLAPLLDSICPQTVQEPQSCAAFRSYGSPANIYANPRPECYKPHVNRSMMQGSCQKHAAMHNAVTLTRLFMNMHGCFRYADAHACIKKKRTHVSKPIHTRVFSLSIFRLDFVSVCNFKTIDRSGK